MAHAINQTAFVVSLLVHDLSEIRGNLVIVLPIDDVVLDLLLHGQNLMVRATVLATLQRPDRRRVRGVRVRIGGRQHVRGERRVVAATVLGMQAQHDVEHARFLRCELPVGAQHGQNGLRRGLTRDETMHDHGLVVVTRADRIVRQYHNAGQAGDEGDGGADLVLNGSILGVFVISVQKQDGSSQHVHDVGRGVAHDHGRGETIGQLALSIDGGDIVGKLLLRGKLAHQQQIGHLFIVESAILRINAQKVV